MKKNWTEITVTGTPDALEGASNRAFELGASGMEETDGGIRLFFSGDSDPESVLRPLSEYVRSLRDMGFSIADPVPRVLAEEDWGRVWRENFKPIRVGGRFTVKPPWEPWTGGPDDRVIDISPKMAFGTGSHETTRLCIEMLECRVRPGMTVLDVGTGSGILAIAALKLGAASALGLDVEEESVENAAENAALNGVSGRFEARLGSLDVLGEAAYRGRSFDLVLANIDRRTLVPMLPALPRHAADGGLVILSGILAEEQGLVLNLIEKPPFRLIEKKVLREWAGFAAAVDFSGADRVAGAGS
jgi:ribosomal protein L11 methyltransferase